MIYLINLNAMKKLLLTIGIITTVISYGFSQTSYGLKAGVNLAKVSPGVEVLKDYQKNHVSFYVTGFADIPVANQFSIQPGISLQGKGSTYEGEMNGTSGSIKGDVMSIEVPVNAVYYIPAGMGKVFLGAGPYVGFNVSGKSVSKVGDEASVEEKLDFSGDDKDMERVDAGLNFLGGYKFNNGFLINAGYGLGLTDQISDSETKGSHRVLSFGVGFQF